MPLANPSTELLKYQGHVHFNRPEGAREVGHNQAPPYVRVSIKLNSHAYGVFRATAHLQRSLDPLVDIQQPIKVYMFTYTDSSVDLITTETLARMGYTVESLMEVSTEGRNLFRDARLYLKGAIFATIRVVNPTSQRATYSRSLVYVADCGRNHLSRQTVEALGLRGNVSLGDLMPLYIPRNA